MEKLYTSKTFLKTTDGRMHTPLDPPLAISYGNHQKSLAYFSHLAPLILFFLLKGKVKRGEGMAQCPPKYAAAVKSKKGLLVLRCSIKRVNGFRLDSR